MDKAAQCAGRSRCEVCRSESGIPVASRGVPDTEATWVDTRRGAHI